MGFGLMAGPVCAQPAPVLGGANVQPLILDVRINGQPQEAMRPILRRGAQLLFARPDVEAWQLVMPRTVAVQRDGIDYLDLLELLGVRLTLDESTQTVRLEVPPDGFKTSLARSRTRTRVPVSAAAFGTFLNYDVALQNDRSGTHASGYFDAAASGSWGLLANSFVVGQSTFAGDHPATRLDTYYRLDDPDGLTRLTVGDSIVRSAVWSTPFRFGGVQFGTQFALSPGYISYPTPTLRGGSALPSAVEVYVNDTLRYQGRADAGPFAVTDVPVLTGAGEMRFAVTDALGVQRTVSAPYYVSSNLLRPGLSDYSVEFGWNRLFYGQRSADYGKPFGSGNWRRGLDENMTVDLHGEAGAGSQTVGSGLTWVWTPFGEFSLHGAASHSSDAGSGHLARASFSRTGESWSFAASRLTASRDFTQVGWQDSFSHVNGQTQVFAGRSLGRYGSLGASFTLLRYNTGERISVLSGNWSITLGQRASLGAYVARTRQEGLRDSNSIGLTLTVPLGDRQTASLSVQRLDGRTGTVAEVDRTAPSGIDGGWGYRVLAASGENARSQASVDGVGRYGTATAEAATYDGRTAVRLRASGALGFAGGIGFATRQSDDAFALVTVPGAAGLKVYRENQHLATTDSEGRAIVSGLRAYETNRIEIDSSDLPIEARIGNDVIQVVPRYKGVAAATFDVSYGTVFNVSVRLPDGSALPAGIDVTAAGRTSPLVSGYDGLVSITSPKVGERFDAHWRSGHCRFTLGWSNTSVCEPVVP